MIQGTEIHLRPARTIDIPTIMKWENNPDNWIVSETDKPYSFEEINLLLDSSEDIFENGQLRMMIVQNDSNVPIGTLDFFQTDFIHNSVHIGILIASNENRRKGYAKTAIELIKKNIQDIFPCEQIICTIQPNNLPSINLFKKCGFELIVKKNQNRIFDADSIESVNMNLWLKK